jgi:hypothetical protein
MVVRANNALKKGPPKCAGPFTRQSKRNAFTKRKKTSEKSKSHIQKNLDA